MLVRAQCFARLSPAEWGIFFSNLGDMIISTTGDLDSIPPSDLHLRKGPGIRSGMLRGLGIAAHAYHRRSGQSADICPFSGERSSLDAFPTSAEIKNEYCEAQALSSGEEQICLGGPTGRMKKLVEVAGARVETRKYVE